MRGVLFADKSYMSVFITKRNACEWVDLISRPCAIGIVLVPVDCKNQTQVSTQDVGSSFTSIRGVFLILPGASAHSNHREDAASCEIQISLMALCALPYQREKTTH